MKKMLSNLSLTEQEIGCKLFQINPTPTFITEFSSKIPYSYSSMFELCFARQQTIWYIFSTSNECTSPNSEQFWHSLLALLNLPTRRIVEISGRKWTGWLWWIISCKEAIGRMHISLRAIQTNYQIIMWFRRRFSTIFTKEMSKNGRLAAFRIGFFLGWIEWYWTIFARLQKYHSHHGLFGCLSQHRIAFEAIDFHKNYYFEF